MMRDSGQQLTIKYDIKIYNYLVVIYYGKVFIEVCTEKVQCYVNCEQDVYEVL